MAVRIADDGSGQPVIGLALGGGAARGWAHAGVIRAMQEAGITPGIIAGTSMGAIVGALLASGRFTDAWAEIESVKIAEVLGYVDSSFPLSSLMDGRLVLRILRSWFGIIDIEDLPVRFAAVASDLATGDEVVMTRGSLTSALRATTSIPLVFPPFRREGRWLVDGGLVNPVPTSVTRALGAGITISVDLNCFIPQIRSSAPRLPHGRLSSVGGVSGESERRNRERDSNPAFPTILLNSLLIMQRSVAASRNASSPSDILIAPDLSGFTGAEFHRARELAMIGYETALPALVELATHLREG